MREHPLRTAVIDDEGSLTYPALDTAARELAGRLEAAGCGSTDIVGVREPTGRAAVIAELAVPAVGAVVLPVPPGSDRLRDCPEWTLTGAGGAHGLPYRQRRRDSQTAGVPACPRRTSARAHRRNLPPHADPARRRVSRAMNPEARWRSSGRPVATSC
ncbi:hypothetical protein ATP06_0216310 [Amycolatopsis regifaucium]|uniref:AMP-dependent synthetase/ligase domain-containing protein n=1 Tax=Amycolatopsis regifaucium TaxID=546365 RepID=A0ABX3DTE1_9PSEU|nr:hypothetical protein ATP06_0216310 [Amycolatopsis regifaucium]